MKQLLLLVSLATCLFLGQAQEDSCGSSNYEDAGECDREGVSCSSESTHRVVGGVEARVHELPYQVSLLYSGSFFCGGFLWDETHVITAAHCTAGDPAELHAIVVGEHDRSDANNDNRNEIACTEIVEHEDYRPLTLENDIAIMTLAEPVDTSHFSRKTICYDSAYAGDNSFGRTSVVSGWGGRFSGGPVIDVLNYASIPVMSYAECEECFGPNEIAPGMLCAGFCDSNDKDTCQGDSGGPLAMKEDGTFYAAGITSWGYGCADTTPGVYADVAYYEDWINENM